MLSENPIHHSHPVADVDACCQPERTLPPSRDR
jgi:hypothetical protein